MGSVPGVAGRFLPILGSLGGVFFFFFSLTTIEPTPMEFSQSSYKGDHVKNRMEGKGNFLFKDGTKYVGDMVDGEFHGHGVMHFPNGSQFEADWKHGNAIAPLDKKRQLAGVSAFHMMKLYIS